LEKLFPVKPDGQLQLTECDRTEHTALGAHGFAAIQGLIQLLSLQISLSPHWEFEVQPGSGFGAVGRRVSNREGLSGFKHVVCHWTDNGWII
jgi:hypothetical protein